MRKRSIGIFSKMSISLTLLFALALSVYAQGTELVPLGRTTGMKFFSDGAVVISFCDINGKSPAEEAGVRIGDVIVSVDGESICTNEDLAKAVNRVSGEVQIDVIRDGIEKQISVTPVISDDGKNYIGAYVRDSMAGIGTITFVDPNTGDFGALGHGVSDMDTGLLMEVARGSLMPSSVIGINKGEAGSPGELQGEYQLQVKQGTIDKNTESGVYGKITDSKLYDGMKTYEIAQKDEIKTGKAQIISNITGEETEFFDIEIIKIYENSEGDYKDMMIKVTDKDLIERTGGIVQGMSGSPIVQNGKLVGAVTHVLVNDPIKGYGIAIENMLKAAG